MNFKHWKKAFRILAFVLLCLLHINVSFSQNITERKIIKISFYYLPWSLKPQNLLTENDVRNYYGKNTIFEITDSNVINEFNETLSILNFRNFKERTKIDVRMVIDFHHSDSTVKTLFLDSRGCVMYDENYYFLNYNLKKCIDKFVPPAIIPK